MTGDITQSTKPWSIKRTGQFKETLGAEWVLSRSGIRESVLTGSDIELGFSGVCLLDQRSIPGRDAVASRPWGLVYSTEFMRLEVKPICFGGG